MAKSEKEPNDTFYKVEDKIQQTILESRRVFISEGIDNQVATQIIENLWYLDTKDPKKPILLVINSPGGSIDAGFAIWDQAKSLSSPIATLVTGLAASMASILSLVAPKKSRFATPMSRFMIHQPLISGVVRGQATDLDIQAQEILKTRDRLIDLYAAETGQTFETIKKAIDRDTWMTSEEAKEFGLIYKIISSYSEMPSFG